MNDEVVDENDLNLAAGSNKKIKLKCSRSHIYEIRVYHKIMRGTSCRICREQYNENSITNFPKLAKEYHESNSREKSTVTIGVMDEFTWQCSECNYIFVRVIYNRIKSLRNNQIDCPNCSETSIEKNNIVVLYPEILQYFHEDNVDPYTIRPRSHTEYKFRCENGHVSLRRMLNATKNIDQMREGKKRFGCKFCDRKTVLFEDSIAKNYPEILEIWSDENTTDPSQISYGSTYRAKLICEYNHIFETTVDNAIVIDDDSNYRIVRICKDCIEYWNEEKQAKDQIMQYILEFKDFPRSSDLNRVYHAIRRHNWSSWFDIIAECLKDVKHLDNYDKIEIEFEDYRNRYDR